MRSDLRRRVPLAFLLGLALLGPAPARASEGDLYVDCRGERGPAPTVILEAGAFGTSADWDFVLDDLAEGGRVCAYDRPGLGRSPPGPSGQDVLATAATLKALLGRLGEARPVILVGHSNGALYVEAFADLWPGQVAGLVYVNGVGSDDLDHPALLADLRAERRASNLAVTAGRLGLSGIVAAELTGQMKLRREASARKGQGLRRLASLKVARDEDRLIIPGLTAVRDLGDAARHAPTVVLTGALDPREPLAREWRAAETAPAARADTAWVLDMPGASHVTPLTRDRAYLRAAVDWLRRPYQTPVLGMDAQGSAGVRGRSF